MKVWMKAVGVIYLDFAKAFDKVPHMRLEKDECEQVWTEHA